MSSAFAFQAGSSRYGRGKKKFKHGGGRSQGMGGQFHTGRGGGWPQRGHTHFSSYSSGSSMPAPPQIVIPNLKYQICKKGGHSACLCLERGNFAYVASTLVDWMSKLAMDEMVDDNWYLDFGASHHMTPGIDQFYDAQLYLGMTTITIGNGKTLKLLILV